MSFQDESGIFDPGRADSDELVRRLRELAWPAVPPEVRERCWSQFSARLSGRDAAADAQAGREVGRRNVGHRLEYTRRIPLRTAQRLASAARQPLWAAGPSRGVAAAG